MEGLHDVTAAGFCIEGPSADLTHQRRIRVHVEVVHDGHSASFRCEGGHRQTWSLSGLEHAAILLIDELIAAGELAPDRDAIKVGV